MKYYLDEAVSLQLDSALTSALILTTFSLKLPSTTNNPLGWALPPLVICAVEAHPVSPLRPLSGDEFSSRSSPH